MITEVETYFRNGCGRCGRFASDDCAARLWSEGLAALRALCLEAGVTETVKWGQPCYTYAGRNVVIFGARQADFQLSFFEAGLMRDPQGVFERAGPNAAVADTIRFRSTGEVEARAEMIAAYLTEAKGNAEAGLRAPKPEADRTLPDALVEALDADPNLAEAFHTLTPGRQRSWALHVSGAKKRATQDVRIAKAREKILAGKGALER